MEAQMEALFDRSEAAADQSVATRATVPTDKWSASPSEVTHPCAVLDHPGLSLSRKRALLAAWASDACAVEGRPAWRQLPHSGAVVAVDDILEALRALDRKAQN